MTDCAVLAAWSESQPAAKLERTLRLQELSQPPAACALPLQPGRPAQPELVHPAEVPRRGLGSVEGRLALLHAIAHIEFNAINLALDAVLRFGPDMPLAFSNDWLSVARDEARHFGMLQRCLAAQGARYGQFPAHNGLWEAAEKTADDRIARMALVPRVLEARGLDVTPGMIKKLTAQGAAAEVRCLDIILREEVRHVAIGSYWYRWLCRRADLDSVAHFRRLLEQLMPGGRGKGPFNHSARAAAGLELAEYDF